MKIGIIGTRGIPNQYGGFEQFVEFVGPALVERGHEITVYNSSLHPYKEKSYKGVRLIHKYDPENKIGTAGQFIYDLNCILDARKRKFDVILQLGYTSSSVWSSLFPKSAVLVTNMDGLEWKRSKYSPKVQKFLLKAEKWAALKSDKLIADSIGIQQYLLEKYNKNAAFIAYGAHVFNDPDDTAAQQFNLQNYGYNLLIARMEPENNVETVLKGYQTSTTKRPLVLIGNHKNKFGSYLKSTYESEKIIFLGPVYDFGLLNNLRYFSHLYFHGHSVGGTNPSLLEAMASQALIVAHDNIFNKSVLGEDAFYFTNPSDVTAYVDREITKREFSSSLLANTRKIEISYSWNHITDLLENYLSQAIYESNNQS